MALHAIGCGLRTQVVSTGVALTLLLTGCGGKENPGGTPDGGTTLPPGDSAPKLSADLTGEFAAGNFRLIIYFEPKSQENEPSQAVLGDGDINVIALRGTTNIPLTRAEVLADGVPVPMVPAHDGHESDFASDVPLASTYEFNIEAGAGNSVNRLVLKPRDVMAPHAITAPATAAVGKDFTVTWSPSGPRYVAARVSMFRQEYESKNLSDSGSHTIPGASITRPTETFMETLMIERESVLGIAGLGGGSGIDYTYQSYLRFPVTP
ncbi:hypothetical protein [Archangium lansingense]|uniref:Lipoprotein n=1 Tax=Archangium lansingense TaxID=2995310 RepID=A0ABT4AP21_9BACT|nr:hypothetical protein [Archangium lansinium]MCY1083428.1 hypothetical protein [Archangium lansinium]